MSQLSIMLTNYILKKGMISKEYYEIYQYGFQHFLEIMISFICSIIIAVVLDMKLECILFFLFFIPLRSYGGGLHMNTYSGCLLLSCATLTTVLVLVKYWCFPPFVSFTICLISILLLKIIGPVNHPNRTVDDRENAVFIRKTNLSLIVSLCVSIIFWVTGFKKYLFLEMLVLLLISITSFLGKKRYS